MLNSISVVRNFLKSRSLPVIIDTFFVKLIKKKISFASLLKRETENKKGLEIGGPSGIFATTGYCPVYPNATQLDCVNFSNSTVWEGSIKEGNNFKYGNNSVGFQWIAEAVNLEKISDHSYDFIISSNCLEHIANPLKAVREWLRVIKSGGIMLLILPNNKGNFDRNRSITSFHHLNDDFNKNISENDLTHLPEILKLHDLKRDPLAGNFEQFKNRGEHNFENRCLHHHVFDVQLLSQIADFFDVQILAKESSVINHHILVKKRI